MQLVKSRSLKTSDYTNNTDYTKQTGGRRSPCHLPVSEVTRRCIRRRQSPVWMKAALAAALAASPRATLLRLARDRGWVPSPSPSSSHRRTTSAVDGSWTGEWSELTVMCIFTHLHGSKVKTGDGLASHVCTDLTTNQYLLIVAIS